MKNDNKTAEQKLSIKAGYIVIVFAVLATVMILGFCCFSGFVNKKNIDTNTASMKELTQHDAACISNSINLRWDNMEAAAKEIAGALNDTPDDLFILLKDKLVGIPSVEKLSLLDSEGVNYISNGETENNSIIAGLCKEKTNRFAVRINTDTLSKNSVFEVLNLAVPVHFSAGEKNFEWMICQLPVNAVKNEIKNSSYFLDGNSAVIDSDGNCIIDFSKNNKFPGSYNLFNDIEQDVFHNSGELRNFVNGSSNSLVYKKGGQKNIMAIAALDISDWYLITTVPQSVFKSQMKSVIVPFALLLAVIVIALILLLYAVFRYNKKQAELEKLNAQNNVKEDYLLSMSHDIRTAMNAVLGYTDIAIRHTEDSGKVKDNLTKIKRSGGNLLNLLTDIMEMSRIDSGKLEITETPTDIGEFLDSLGQMGSSLAKEKSIDFQLEYGEISNPYVYADNLHLNKVLINLIANAVKYTHEGGNVKLTAAQLSNVSDGRAIYRFEVIDNGIGMSDEFQQHLFEAFSREHASAVSGREGRDLGLSIVKKIVDMAGGIISVRSKAGEGSAFVVDLPLRVMDDVSVEQYKVQNGSVASDERDFSFEGKKVLLVDDNEINRDIATELLEDNGLSVDTAEDGECAIKSVTEKGITYYDFILMDIQMPVMDGYTATSEIRKLSGGDNLTIIALSANAFEEDVMKSRACGMNAHIAKPIDMELLFDTMKELAIARNTNNSIGKYYYSNNNSNVFII